MIVTDKQRSELKEFTKDELVDYIEQLLSKIERLNQTYESQADSFINIEKDVHHPDQY
jgi:Fe-S cluster assembly scaffold protein SufB